MTVGGRPGSFTSNNLICSPESQGVKREGKERLVLVMKEAVCDCGGQWLTHQTTALPPLFISVRNIISAGTNDAFVTIGLGKEKFQTSVKEKSDTPDWSEQCEL